MRTILAVLVCGLLSGCYLQAVTPEGRGADWGARCRRECRYSGLAVCGPVLIWPGDHRGYCSCCAPSSTH